MRKVKRQQQIGKLTGSLLLTTFLVSEAPAAVLFSPILPSPETSVAERGESGARPLQDSVGVDGGLFGFNKLFAKPLQETKSSHQTENTSPEKPAPANVSEARTSYTAELTPTSPSVVQMETPLQKAEATGENKSMTEGQDAVGQQKNISPEKPVPANVSEARTSYTAELTPTSPSVVQTETPLQKAEATGENKSMTEGQGEATQPSSENSVALCEMVKIVEFKSFDEILSSEHPQQDKAVEGFLQAIGAKIQDESKISWSSFSPYNEKWYYLDALQAVRNLPLVQRRQALEILLKQAHGASLDGPVYRHKAEVLTLLAEEDKTLSLRERTENTLEREGALKKKELIIEESFKILQEQIKICEKIGEKLSIVHCKDSDSHALFYKLLQSHIKELQRLFGSLSPEGVAMEVEEKAFKNHMAKLQLFFSEHRIITTSDALHQALFKQFDFLQHQWQQHENLLEDYQHQAR